MIFKGCDSGHYGENCSSNCDHCKNNATCGIQNGECDNNGCAGPRYQPPLCKGKYLVFDKGFSSSCNAFEPHRTIKSQYI